MFNSPQELKQALNQQDYIADDDLATVAYLSSVLQKPLLVEGPAGVGKTQLAVAMARAFRRKLIRLQCYEGIDASKALYDWNYHRQLLRIQAGQGEGWKKAGQDIFSREFLLQRPLLQALLSQEPAVLLIDELDKSNEEFESFLLELLAEFQVTIPELGTLEAVTRPLVVLTSNGSRDFGDALRRRCLHLFINYPDLEREEEIVARHCRTVNSRLIRTGTELVQKLRKLPLRKLPSVAESIDFVQAISLLEAGQLTEASFSAAAATLLKYPQDVRQVHDKLPYLIGDGGPNE